MDCKEILERIRVMLEDTELRRVNPRCVDGRLVVDDVQFLVERLLRVIDDLESEMDDCYYDEEEYDFYPEDYDEE